MGNSHSSSSSGKRRHFRSSSPDVFPPGPPGKPYLVVTSPAVEPDVITVRWKPPAFDGGAEIEGYIVEHRRTISPHWVKATPDAIEENQLRLSGLEPGWRYQFRVKSGNCAGISTPSAVSDPVTITVQRTAVVAPVFVRGIEDHVALENDQVKFEVEFEGMPAPKISWYKDGFELFSNRRQRINTDNGVSTLYIHQAEYSDEGEIKCSATNKAGHAITKARLRLEAPPMVRLPQDYEEGLLLEQNEPMRLKVSVSGRPLPQVTWLHDGEEIRGGERFEVIHTDKYAALKLACVKRSDRGCYQVQAVNPLGEHMASFLVTVTDRPSPPGKVNASKTSGKSVTLSWKQPEDDGGCKIGNYIIEYNRVGWDMWLKASTSRQLTADLDDLLEGSEYRFRVKAENPYGISLPSEVSDPIFLPDIKRGIYKPINTTSLLSEDDEKLVISQETEMLENFGRKSKSPEPPSKPRKLSVDEVSPPVPQRRKKKSKINDTNSETDIYKSFSHLDVSAEPWQQPIEQKDHWGLPPGLKANNGATIIKDSKNSQMTSLDYKSKGNSNESLSFFKYDKGSAPPISLSSPELGAESEGFEEHIRNSYSSSELLYERNLDRFNTYSNNDDNSEAQKIAIYEMDRKNSLRRSPITRRSNDDFEEKSIFSDSDSIHSVIEISKPSKMSSFTSLQSSIEEEEEENVENDDKKSIDDENMIPSTSFTRSKITIESDDEYISNSSDEEYMKFGSGKRALDQNTSSAFFSTVYFDDDYLSDHKLSDRERSVSPAIVIDKADIISQDSLNSESMSSSDYSQLEKDNVDEEMLIKSNCIVQNIEHLVDNAEINAIEPIDIYRPRDGIPKYVMLPNPFYKENNTATDASNKVKFELSSNSDEIVPPEIPIRENNNNIDSHLALPVITVTEINDHSPKSILKKIFVPTFAGTDESYYNKYNNVNSSTFNTLKKSPDRDVVETEKRENALEVQPAEDSTMVIVKHYGDILERYSCVGKKTVSKTYLDFEQLKMAAVEDEPEVVLDQPVGEEEKGYGSEMEEEEIPYPVVEEKLNSENYDLVTPNNQLVIFEKPASNTIPYLEIFGNLSLGILGYWLYVFKDERLSVPVFGFLFFRFFKTQIWDRI